MRCRRAARAWAGRCKGRLSETRAERRVPPSRQRGCSFDETALARKNDGGFPQIQRSRRFTPAVSVVSLNLRENTLWCVPKRCDFCGLARRSRAPQNHHHRPSPREPVPGRPASAHSLRSPIRFCTASATDKEKACAQWATRYGRRCSGGNSGLPVANRRREAALFSGAAPVPASGRSRHEADFFHDLRDDFESACHLPGGAEAAE